MDVGLDLGAFMPRRGRGRAQDGSLSWSWLKTLVKMDGFKAETLVDGMFLRIWKSMFQKGMLWSMLYVALLSRPRIGGRTELKTACGLANILTLPGVLMLLEWYAIMA